MSDKNGMSALTEKGALDMAIATLQSRVKERDEEIERLRVKIKTVVETFERDEAQGYHSKDRRFVLQILKS